MKSNQDIIETTIPAEKKQERGVTTVEYAVMLVLVALAVIIFGKGIGNSITGVFSQLVSALG